MVIQSSTKWHSLGPIIMYKGLHKAQGSSPLTNVGAVLRELEI